MIRVAPAGGYHLATLVAATVVLKRKTETATARVGVVRRASSTKMATIQIGVRVVLTRKKTQRNMTVTKSITVKEIGEISARVAETAMIAGRTTSAADIHRPRREDASEATQETGMTEEARKREALSHVTKRRKVATLSVTRVVVIETEEIVTATETMTSIEAVDETLTTTTTIVRDAASLATEATRAATTIAIAMTAKMESAETSEVGCHITCSSLVHDYNFKIHLLHLLSIKNQFKINNGV